MKIAAGIQRHLRSEILNPVRIEGIGRYGCKGGGFLRWRDGLRIDWMDQMVRCRVAGFTS
jgi:hypothetical protein